MLIEQGLGTYPVICVLDAAARGKPMPTLAYSQEQIRLLLLSIFRSSDTRRPWVIARTS
jgi:hypothetical protein